MTENELKRVLDFEDPILFLGAGFSLGAKTKVGKVFPTGNELKKDIIVNLLKYSESTSEYLDLMNYSLSDICDHAEREKSSAHLTDFLVSIFQKSQPADFHHKINLRNWKKIYTTNIDDVIENSYKNLHRELLIQNFKRRSTIELGNKLEYIKLHGCVNNPSEGLTFSTRSYLDTMLLQQDYRFSSLMFDMHSETIIFLGHAYSDFNIDFYLKLYENSGFKSSKGRLVFINPNPSIIFEGKAKILGASIIRWNTEKFFEFIEQNQSKKENAAQVAQLTTITRYGFKNVKAIRDGLVPIKGYESDLYFGSQPDWKDIFDEWDFINPELIKEFQNFLLTLKEEFSGTFSIYGKSLSGKSAYLLRLGQILLSEGYEVWQFKGKYFNYFEFYKYIKANSDRKQFALVMDDSSYNYGGIKRLVSLIPSEQRLVVLTTSRISTHFRLRYNLIETKFTEHYLEPKINKQYGVNILAKLKQKGYLGILKEKATDTEKLDHIINQNDVLTILYDITYGKGFIKRLNTELNPILEKESAERDFLFVLAIFDRLDLPYVPRELMSLLYGKESNVILERSEAFIKHNYNNDLSIRTGFYLQTILRKATKNKIVAIIKSVLIAVSPHINESQQNYWNQIESAFIKEKQLKKRFDLNNSQIKSMLYELKNFLSESYNYWLQLGISEQLDKDFEKAMNHFRQAEVINPGSYMVKNAIGRNFLKQANNLDKESIARKIFEEGEDILLDLINKREEHQVRAFSTHTYIYEKINYFKKFKIKPSNSELKKLFDFLKNVIDKDPEDFMAKHISNYFMDYLRVSNRTNIIKLKYHNLELLRNMLTDIKLDIEDVLDE